MFSRKSSQRVRRGSATQKCNQFSTATRHQMRTIVVPHAHSIADGDAQKQALHALRNLWHLLNRVSVTAITLYRHFALGDSNGSSSRR